MRWQGTRPTDPPLVTWTQMQAQLRIDATDEQQYITDLVDAATEYAEQALDSSLLTRTITATYYAEPPVNLMTGTVGSQSRLFLPRGPVQSITSITDANNTAITSWRLQRFGLADFVLLLQSYVGPLTIVYVAGYGSSATDVPADLRMAIRTHVASLWRNRESISDRKMEAVPQSLESFYALRRRNTVVG